MNALESTVAAAKRVLESSGDAESCITGLDAYVAGLNKFLKQLEEMPEKFPREDLAMLDGLHQQVLATAVQLLGNTSIDLRQLQAKGRAILAYTDTLPKRVSIRAKQKG